MERFPEPQARAPPPEGENPQKKAPQRSSAMLFYSSFSHLSLKIAAAAGEICKNASPIS